MSLPPSPLLHTTTHTHTRSGARSVRTARATFIHNMFTFSQRWLVCYRAGFTSSFVKELNVEAH